jgi:hypothetical protein
MLVSRLISFYGTMASAWVKPLNRRRSMLCVMETLNEYDTVKVVRLLQSERRYHGTSTVMRPPQIGDTGAIVHIYFVQNEASGYIVENVAPDGNTIWLADFLPDEIEKVS